MNDNLGLLTRNPRWADTLINRIRCAAKVRDLSNYPVGKDNERGKDSDNTDDPKHDGVDHQEYVQRRLSDLAAFERRASGKKGS